MLGTPCQKVLYRNYVLVGKEVSEGQATAWPWELSIFKGLQLQDFLYSRVKLPVTHVNDILKITIYDLPHQKCWDFAILFHFKTAAS